MRETKLPNVWSLSAPRGVMCAAHRRWRMHAAMLPCAAQSLLVKLWHPARCALTCVHTCSASILGPPGACSLTARRSQKERSRAAIVSCLAEPSALGP
eukprot:364198-Chlamydomonas_euryale.AAC.14